MTEAVLKIPYYTTSPDLGIAPWGQWEPPKPGQDWHRPTDFDGYNHKAVPFVKSLKIYSSAGLDKNKPIILPSGYTAETYLMAEVELDQSINAEIRFSDLQVDSGYTELGKLYLTLLLLSAEHDEWHYAAQSPNRIKDEGAKARAILYTSSIPDISKHQGSEYMIVVCLAPHMDINEDHTYSGPSLPSEHWSLDINGAGYKQIIADNVWGVYGDGNNGGSAVITYRDFIGRFNLMQGLGSPLDWEFFVLAEGGAELVIKGRYDNLVTWTSTPQNTTLPDNTRIYVDLMLTPQNGAGLPFTRTYEIEFLSGSDNAVYVIDNVSLNIPTEELAGRGEFAAQLTFRIGIESQPGQTRYRFFDADAQIAGTSLSVTVDAGTVTF